MYLTYYWLQITSPLRRRPRQFPTLLPIMSHPTCQVPSTRLWGYQILFLSHTLLSATSVAKRKRKQSSLLACKFLYRHQLKHPLPLRFTQLRPPPVSGVRQVSSAMPVGARGRLRWTTMGILPWQVAQMSTWEMVEMVPKMGRIMLLSTQAFSWRLAFSLMLLMNITTFLLRSSLT